MNIQFSTTCDKLALEYLQKALKSYDITEENSKSVLGLVGVKVRVGDPFMYNGNAPIFPMPGANEAEANIVFSDWLSSLKRKEAPVSSVIPYAPAETHEDDVLNKLADEDIG